MKKLLCGVLSAMLLVLAACSTSITVYPQIRWAERTEETYYEECRYAVIGDNSYSREELKGSLLLPVETEGECVTTMTAERKDGRWLNTLTVTTLVNEAYALSHVRNCIGDLEGGLAVVPSEYYEITENRLWLRTKVESKVVFEVGENMTESVKTVEGAIIVIDAHTKSPQATDGLMYYAAECHIEFNDYAAEIVKIDSKRCEYKVVFGKQYPECEDITGKVSVSNAGAIDSGALFYGVRAYDMEVLKEAGSFAVNVLDIAAGSMRSASLQRDVDNTALNSLLPYWDEETGSYGGENRLSGDLFDNHNPEFAKVRLAVSGASSVQYLYFYFDLTTLEEAAKNNFKVEGSPDGRKSKNRLVLYQQNHMILMLNHYEYKTL